MFSLVYLSVVGAKQISVVTQNVAAKNESPFEYANAENADIVRHMTDRLTTVPINLFVSEEMVRSLGESNLCGAGVGDYPAIPTETFVEYFRDRKVSGEKDLADRPAAPFNDKDLGALENFPALFIAYIAENNACKYFTGKTEKETAENLMSLFIYDISIFFSLHDYPSDWKAEKQRLSGFMASAIENVIPNIFKNFPFEFIALQETTNKQSLNIPSAQYGMIFNNPFGPGDDKETVSVLYYRLSTFEHIRGEFSNVKEVRIVKKGKAKSPEYVCGVFRSKEEPSPDVCICSFHADSDGTVTKAFIDAFSADCAAYPIAILAMDGNVVSSKKDAEKKSGIHFEGLLAQSEELGLVLNNVPLLTTHKTRTYAQAQISKADKLDKNPKDHILYRGLDNMVIKAYNRCPVDQATCDPWVEDLAMPNKDFGADHALLVLVPESHLRG
jgi:hypothetical protein